MTNLITLPDNLPIPADDGACDHLIGLHLPDLELKSNQGQWINLSKRPGLSVIFVYPMTGQPDKPLPSGWNDIPGARGCTPEACGFRDYHQDMTALGATVFGLSSQHDEEQREASSRLNLPYLLLSDDTLQFATALSLPLFEFAERTLIKRLTLICRDAVIEHCFYPVFPPDQHAEAIFHYLSGNARVIPA